MTHQPIIVTGLSDDDNRLVNLQLEQLAQKTPRNVTRRAHYDMKHAVRQVATILPPAYSTLATTVGWSAKAVDMLARRCKVKSVTWSGGDIQSLGSDELWAANGLESEFGQGITSAMLHATAFVATVEGDADNDEPPASIHFFDALDATGVWSGRARRLSSALIVDDRNGEARPSALTMHLPGDTVTMKQEGGTWKVVDRSEHNYGMTVDALRYRPRLGRPFGASRLTRAMMSISDMAIRELLRLEGHMDAYSFPELWMLGADLSVFGEDADSTQIMLGRLKGIPDDDTAVNPRVALEQVAASSPEPHLAALNAHAKLFARESGLPDSSLAITDLANPTSAEAYDASQHDLIAEAEGAVDDFTPELARAYSRALAIQNGDPSLIDTLESGLRPQWRNPKYTSRAAEADAGLKQLQALPWLAQTSVAPELVGLTADQARRADADRKRAAAAERLASVATLGSVPAEDYDALKAQGEALGALVRAGVVPEDAAREVGLNVRFTGEHTVTLRPDED